MPLWCTHRIKTISSVSSGAANHMKWDADSTLFSKWIWMDRWCIVCKCWHTLVPTKWGQHWACIFDCEHFFLKQSNFMKWKITQLWWDSNPPPLNFMPSALIDYWAMGMWVFPIHINWDTGSGNIYILFLKVNPWNANHAWVTTPILDWEQLFLKQWKSEEVENNTPLVGLNTPLLHNRLCALKIGINEWMMYRSGRIHVWQTVIWHTNVESILNLMFGYQPFG